jgi:hypothetical protein
MQNLKAKPIAKPIAATVATVAPIATDKPKAAPAPFVHVHADNGVSASHYAGLSSYLNANRVASVRTLPARTKAITPRQIATLRAMRDAYAGKAFIARGFDNGAVANLIAAKFLRPSDGVATTLNGQPYTIDGEKPLKLTVTATGLAFGKATK